jgi:hypothetical protein
MMENEKRNKDTAKLNGVILQAICSLGTKKAGEAIGRDASFISRCKTGEAKLTIDEICALFIACDLIIERSNDEYISVEKPLYDSLVEFANIGLKFIKQNQES